jgi:hypothetical protein
LPLGAAWIEDERAYNFEIQEIPTGGWRRAIDTGRDGPDDIAEPGEEPPIALLR